MKKSHIAIEVLLFYVFVGVSRELRLKIDVADEAPDGSNGTIYHGIIFPEVYFQATYDADSARPCEVPEFPPSPFFSYCTDRVKVPS
jgi:hypothetical protein